MRLGSYQRKDVHQRILLQEGLTQRADIQCSSVLQTLETMQEDKEDSTAALREFAVPGVTSTVDQNLMGMFHETL